MSEVCEAVIEEIAAYSESNVRVLEGLEAVRKRPAMYIGNTGIEGFHHLVYEIVDNAVDESFAKVCKKIQVSLLDDNVVRITDNGRGIPVMKHAQTGRPTVETVMTVLHAGAKFDNGAYKVSGGLHGVGLSVVNALSAWLEVEVHRNGQIWKMRCERGVPVEIPVAECGIPPEKLTEMFEDTANLQTSSIECLGTTKKTGTIVTFQPDIELFEVSEFSPVRLSKRLEELSYLVPKVRFIIDSPQTSQTFYSTKGIDDLLLKHCSEHRGFPVSIELETADATLNIAMAFNQTGTERLYSYANGINTHDGGTHVSTFRMALSKAVSMFSKDHMIKLPTGALEEIKSDVTAVIEIRLSDPQFESQTKVKLRNSNIQKTFLKLLIDAIKHELEKQTEIVEQILREAVTISAKKLKLKDELTRLKKTRNKVERSLPGKLSDCTSRKTAEREIFIVEGDSAGGSLKKCKNNKTQAALPLRGKTLNVEKADFEDRVLKNESLLSIAASIGLQFDAPDISSLRYGKVIIMTDADADGSHITLLLLSFFYTYFQDVIDTGKLYISVPPLYRVKNGSNSVYLAADSELDAYLDKLSPRAKEKAVIQRFKGLGEMNPDQLWETCVNPGTRRLLQVTVDDAEFARKTFDITLGTSADARKAFIRENASLLDDSFVFEVC